MNFQEWLEEAVRAISCGITDKMTLDNVTVYRVNNIIRIDIIKED